MGQLSTASCLLAIILVLHVYTVKLGQNVSQPIHIIVNLKNVVNANKILANFARMFDSVLRGARHRPLHWIFITQTTDVSMIHSLVQKIITQKADVHVQVDYVNMDVLAARFAPQINLTRHFFICQMPAETSTYYDEMFHLYAIYHIALPFERLIALDADLHFQDGVDIADLDQHFELMSPDNLIAIGPDLSPHYWYHFRQYRKKHPDSTVGKRFPGLQGFNGGVVLMHLERMRRSRLYNSYLLEENLDALVSKYELDGCLAYQDLWTVMSMEHRRLYYLLDCNWNRQLDEMYGFVEHFSKIFETFHRCDGDIKIYHANGGSLLLEDRFDHSNSQIFF